MILGFVLAGYLSIGTSARAGDFRFYGGLGLGGAGITKTPSSSASTTTSTDTTTSTSTDATSTSVQRNEGPGVITLGIEKILSHRYTLAFDHSRGFRLGPFSSGVSFTGFTTRYYFDAVPWGAKETKGQPTIFVKRLFGYIGGGIGVATGTIERTNDLVPNVSASGVYLGIRFGYDIPLNQFGTGIRPELMLSQTIASSATDPSSLSLFFLGCQFYFQL